MRDVVYSILSSHHDHSPQLSTENERKSLQAQINNERMISADQKRAYEKEIEMLRNEIDKFEVEKKALLIEKASTLLVFRFLILLVPTHISISPF